MTTAYIPIKDFRTNMKCFTGKSHKDHIIYIVTRHHKPLFEVKPCYNESISFDESQMLHYKQLDKNLAFWNSSEDDEIFSM